MLWHAFCQTVTRAHDEIALIHGDRSWTFAQWAARANSYRHRFRQIGVRRNERVLLWMTNTFDIAAAMTACWGEGAIPALMDAGCRGPQLENAAVLINPVLVVCSATDKLPECSVSIPRLVTGEVPDNSDSALPPPYTVPTDPASIVFTSGSTGKPKGVTQSHGNLLRGCKAVAGYLGLKHTDRLLCPVPWSFDYGFGQLISTIVLGIRHVIPTQFNPTGICESIATQQPTVIAGLPALYTYLVSGMSPIQVTDRHSVRLLTNTGGTMPTPVLRSLFELFDGTEIVLNYGLTETYRSCYLPPALVRNRYDSIGIPIPGADIVIVREDGTVAEPGESGQIVHRGDYVCLGYWNDPVATARAVRSDPLTPLGCPSPGRALFTGDYGRRDSDGFIYYQGRHDHQLKCMGVRVSPGEVERLLFESGLVSEVAVFGLPHDMLGHEICAVVVMNGPHVAEQRTLERYARAQMSQFMLPRRYVYVERLPRTVTGKVDYPSLREGISDESPEFT